MHLTKLLVAAVELPDEFYNRTHRDSVIYSKANLVHNLTMFNKVNCVQAIKVSAAVDKLGVAPDQSTLKRKDFNTVRACLLCCSG